MSPDRVLLSAADLDAYLPERATTNAYTRPRLELKQRLLAWGRRVVVRVAEQGLALQLHASDEHPSLRNHWRVDALWLFLFSEPEERASFERLFEQKRRIAEVVGEPSPAHRHALLALRVAEDGVSLGLSLHPDARVDLDNLRARVANDGPLADELAEAIARLPDQFTMGASPARRLRCEAASAANLRDLVAEAERDRAPLWIGWSVPRDVALAHAEALDEQLEDALLALAPIYRLIAWSPDNDHVGLGARIGELRAERAKHHAEAEEATHRWRESRAAEGARPRLTGPATAPSPAPRGAPSEPRRPNGDSAHAEPGIEEGARVLATKGPFAARVGVVAELLGRSSARVLFGLLSTRMDLADLRPAIDPRERPALQSSHRRPLPTAPRRTR